MKTRHVILAQRPVGLPTGADFSIEEIALDEPADGDIVVENICMSVDPYMRGRMIERKSYAPPFQVGEPLTGGAIGRVVDSKDPNVPVGAHVESSFGWREAFVAHGSQVRLLGNLEAPASAYLGVLGMPGMTAYAGLLEVGALKEDDVVFVSGAAGAVGSAAGQIARIKGCRTIGSAGGPEKVAHLKDDLGFDHAFDYRDGNLETQITVGAPDGIDVFFDNVGGEHLQAAINCMRPLGRIALCGSISGYNATEALPGPNNLGLVTRMQLRLEGFLVGRFNHLREAFDRDMTEWVTSGQLKYQETVFDGLDAASEAFIGLFTGVNTGKMVVDLTK